MNKRILKAIIANLMDALDDEPESILTANQLDVVRQVVRDVEQRGDFLFDDPSEEYELGVVRAFIRRKSKLQGGWRLDIPPEKHEEFIQDVYEQLVK